MRTFIPVLLVLIGCAHSPTASRDYGACTSVTSPRDILRVKADQERMFQAVAKEVLELSRQIDAAMTVGLNARNRSDFPLTVEETLQAQGRLAGVQKIIDAEARHLSDLAGKSGAAGPLDEAPDGIAAEPRLTALREECREIRARTDAELSQSRHVLANVAAEIQEIARDYRLPSR